MRQTVQYYPSEGARKNRGQERSNLFLLTPPRIVARDGRYVAYDNGIICDCYANREWFVGANQDTSWFEAKKWVKSLSVSGGGWALPSINQLKGLYCSNKDGDRISPLFNLEATDIWSGEDYDEASVWGFNFIPGNAFRTYRSYKSRFRALATRMKPRYR